MPTSGFSSKQSGFTLLEVLIALTIVVIIGAIAYPSYVEQVRKSRRSDAQIKLQEFAQLQESFFSRNMTYAPNLSTLLGGGSSTRESNEGFYQLSVSSATRITGGACSGTRASPCAAYTLQAIPLSGTSQAKDSNCARLTLDNMGRRTANATSVWVDTTDQCW